MSLRFHKAEGHSQCKPEICWVAQLNAETARLHTGEGHASCNVQDCEIAAVASDEASGDAALLAENARLKGERDALAECLDMAVQGLEQAARTLRRQRSPSLRRDAASDMEGFLRTIGNLRPRSAPATDNSANHKPGADS